jgi:hypothetical protein
MNIAFDAEDATVPNLPEAILHKNLFEHTADIILMTQILMTQPF